MLDRGYLYGNIGASMTKTEQDKDAGLFYTCSDKGNDGASWGAGVNLFGWFGREYGVSSEGNTYSYLQFTPWFHTETSVGFDGVKVSIGWDNGDISYDVEIRGGLGLIALFAAPIAGTYGTPWRTAGAH